MNIPVPSSRDPITLDIQTPNVRIGVNEAPFTSPVAFSF